MLKSGRSELSPLFMKMMAKMQSRSPAICMLCGISSKRKIDRIVGIRMPSLLNVVVNGAPFLRILIWSSTSAGKEARYHLRYRRPRSLHCHSRSGICPVTQEAYQASSQIIPDVQCITVAVMVLRIAHQECHAQICNKWQQSDKSYIQSPRIKAFLHA